MSMDKHKAYEDIINLPHHVSANRPQMPLKNRAAQFSPFAALTGYESAVAETARITERRIELSECVIEELNRKLQMLAESAADQPEIIVTYYEPDEKKDGGAYVTAKGRMKKIDEYEGIIVFTDDRRVFVEDIYAIELCGEKQVFF